MQLGVLGPLVLTDDADRRSIGGPQQHRLLAALAVRSPAPVPTDTLEDLLWPHGAPSRNALQAQISKLRKAVAPIAVQAIAGGYALDIDPASLDAARFERLVAAGREAAASGDQRTASARLRDALALWRGEPYQEIVDHFVGQAASARLSSLRDAAIEARVRADLAVGNLDDAAAELEARVIAEPLVEQWWALLMLTRYRQQRQAEALRLYADARHHLAEQLGLEPGDELREMERRILQHDPTLLDGQDHRLAQRTSTSRSITTRSTARVPARVAPFVGRADELDAVGDLARGARLVSIVGPGGSGKTSIAYELARRAEVECPGGEPGRATSRQVLLVELAALVGTSDVAGAIANALGLDRVDRAAPTAGSLDHADDRDTDGGTVHDSDRGTAHEMDHGTAIARVVADVIADRDVLIVIDNCEHVIDDVARTVHTLLARCPHLRVIATSREALDIPGETVWHIPPMRPDEAVELFVVRARAIGVDPITVPTDRELTEQLVERLDGLPLAIELAAARMRGLGLADIVERLDDRFALLTTGARTATPRQQTLRGVVDWSHDLLDEAERTVFRRLGAFVGGASPAAAAIVCADPDDGPSGDAAHEHESARVAISRDQVDEILQRLALKSLVVADRSSGNVRFTMLQTLQQYAAERLVDAGENEVVRLRHARVFADLLAPAERGLLGHDQSRHLALIAAERENIGVALDHAIALGQADLALSLVAPIGWYFFMVAEGPLGVDWLGQALSCPGPSDARRRALALGMFAWLAVTSPDVALAPASAATAIEMLDVLDDPWTETLVAGITVMTYLFLGRLPDCLSVLELTHAAARRSGERWPHAITRIVDAEVATHLGRVDVAERNYAEAVDTMAAAGDQFMRVVALSQAAELAEARGDYDRAVRDLEESVITAAAVGFSASAIGIPTRLANLEALRGNVALAEELHRAALASPAGATSPWLRAMALVGLAMIARRRGDPAAAVTFLDEASAMPRTHAVPMTQTIVATALGYSEDQRGDAASALAHQRDSVRTALALGGARTVANALEGLAGAVALAGSGEPAARLLGRADALRRSAGAPMPAAERFDVDRAEARARALLGDDRFDAAFASGAAATTDDVLAGIAIDPAR